MSVGNELSNMSTEEKININFSFATTNARSLPPKIVAMIECFRELDLSFFTITETWLLSNSQTAKEINDLAQSENISLLTRNRSGRGGGVAVAFDSTKMTLKTERLTGNDYEIHCAVGCLNSMKRKIVILTVYVPPKTTVPRFQALASFLSEAIEKMNMKHDLPYFVVTGDFNRRDIGPHLLDFPDIKLIEGLATRDGVPLDLTYTNLKVKSASSLPPLESNSGFSKSDHNIVSVVIDAPPRNHFVKTTFSFRPFTERGKENFGRLLARTDWSSLQECDASAAATKFKDILDCYTDHCFPVKTRTVKSCDPPWISVPVRQAIRRKKREYKRNRRSRRWKILCAESDRVLHESRLDFFNKVKERMLESRNSRDYFQAIKRLGDGDQTNHQWKINDLYPGKSDGEIASEVAEFFNRISREYEPLLPQDSNAASHLCPAAHEIAGRLKSFRKPRSRVSGDVFPQIATDYADLLAQPLHLIFNKCFTSGSWPSLWKTETVSVIPKVTRPSGPGQLRNLSCTPLFSKLMEAFILDRLKTEAPLGNCQYGGIKGSSVDHFLVESWDSILQALEDPNAAVSVASLDFEKVSIACAITNA